MNTTRKFLLSIFVLSALAAPIELKSGWQDNPAINKLLSGGIEAGAWCIDHPKTAMALLTTLYVAKCYYYPSFGDDKETLIKLSYSPLNFVKDRIINQRLTAADAIREFKKQYPIKGKIRDDEKIMKMLKEEIKFVDTVIKENIKRIALEALTNFALFKDTIVDAGSYCSKYPCFSSSSPIDVMLLKSQALKNAYDKFESIIYTE